MLCYPAPIRRTVREEFTISSANGNTSRAMGGPATFNSSGVVLDFWKHHQPIQGRLLNLKARLVNGGGWTFTSIQVKAARPILLAEGVSGLVSAWSAGLGDEQVIYDSGAVAPGAGSATACFAEAAFADKEQGWLRWWMLGLEWVTSAGSGSSTVYVSADYEVFVP